MYPADLYASTELRQVEYSSVTGSWELLLESDRDRLALIFATQTDTPELFSLSPFSELPATGAAPLSVFGTPLILEFSRVAGLVQSQWYVRSNGSGTILTVTEVLFKRRT